MNKYYNKKKDGFHSIKEYKRYQELLLLQRAGKICGLDRQVRFEIIPAQPEVKLRPTFYYADFVYWQNGKLVVEDVKGYKGGQAYAIFMIKKKLMFQRYGYLIKET